MQLRTAQRIARELEKALKPSVERQMVVGSVRRGVAYPGDVELLVEPRSAGGSLFDQDDGEPDVEAVRAAFTRYVGRGRVVKAGRRMLQGELEGGVKLELWICHPPASWGTLMAIRTGPLELGKLAVTRIRQRGWRVKHGAVWQPTTEENPAAVELAGEDGWWAKRATPTEREFFAFAGLDLVPAHKRAKLASQRHEPIERS